MELKKHLQPHAVLIPLPLQGHINPFTHLAMKLASKGFTITFVGTESTHQQMAKSQSLKDDGNPFSHAQKSGLDIRYAKISDGFPLSFDRRANVRQFVEGLSHVFQAHVDDFLENLVLSKQNPPISCIIADSFHVWGSMIAKKYNLVNVSFWTEPATVLTVLYHMDLLKSNGHFGCHGKHEDTIRYIPGIQAIQPEDLPSYCQDADPSSSKYVFKCIEDAQKADFVIGNTVQELESSTISILQEQQPFYAIGPILPTNFTKSTISTNLLPASDYTDWLNTKQDGTVLYISFGSLANLSKQDILEIAQGILISKVSFIWVLRHNILVSGERDILPLGFEEETADRGLVVPWCSQLAVLSHPSVGGFLTHCGWNSVLESIWCEVPMICFPVTSDQLTNRKLVVDDWRIGVNLRTGRLIRREGVAENIGKIMSRSNEMKKNVEKTRMIVQNELSDEGSSEKNLNQFIEDMKNKILQKN
ncbi:UDP-glycosyltransferase 86A1 [Capsicum annuum]|uniref:UDP-glycosyltransferase 86A1 n=1 Tax=Capsicum annuum TaxID=4072 RepID=UPI0007BF6F92|nr:UDP-glycosyltransferase 86A1 [Capsicum annuum]KAF3646203.1 UDP-glycosyltransferase 86A1 [Capsicum annuum]